MFSAALKAKSMTSKISKASSSMDKKSKKTSDDEDDVEKAPPRKRPRLSAIRKKVPNMTRRINKTRCAITWLIILFLVAIAAVLAYFFAFVKYAQYYEYGVLRDGVGKVDAEWVYWNQWVARGPAWTMIKYPSTVQNIVLRNMSVGAKDELGIQISLTFQYYIRRWDVPALYNQFRFNYSEPIINSITDSIKEGTPRYDSRLFLTERKQIESGLLELIRDRVEGRCCLRDCEKNATRPCREECIERDLCKPTDMGVYVEVRHLYLLEVNYPQVLADTFLKNTLSNLTGQTSLNLAISRQETDLTNLMISEIRLEEKRMNESAKIEANLIESIARSNYTAVTRSARGQALGYLCQRLNITSEAIKNSLEYNKILSETNSIHMNVDYQPLFVKTREP